MSKLTPEQEKQVMVNRALANCLQQAYIVRMYNPNTKGLKVTGDIPVEIIEYAFELLPKEERKAFFPERTDDTDNTEPLRIIGAQPVNDDKRSTLNVRINE